jgi:F-type H+-transporting ATPase subunit delta
MNMSLVSERYAAALFELSVEKSAVEAVSADMQTILRACEQSRDLRLLLRSPIIQTGKKLKIIREIFSAGIHPMTLAFLEVMVRKRRERYLQEVAGEFIELYDEFRNILTVKFKAPVPPDEDVTRQVTELMKRYTGADINLRSEIDESLIGGFVLRWKDKQYDASIHRELENLRNAIAKINLYKKEF